MIKKDICSAIIVFCVVSSAVGLGYCTEVVLNADDKLKAEKQSSREKFNYFEGADEEAGSIWKTTPGSTGMPELNESETKWKINYGGGSIEITNYHFPVRSPIPKAGSMYSHDVNDVKYIYVTASASDTPARVEQLFFENGLSAHFLVEPKGNKVRLYVRPRYNAYCAGKSAYGDTVNLNSSSICVILCHPGTNEHISKGNEGTYEKPIAVGKDRYVPFLETQVTATNTLIGFLREQFKVPSFNVVQRGDASGTRGGLALYPLCPFKSMSNVYWPKKVLNCPPKLKDEDIVSLIQAIGYSKHENSFGTKDGTSIVPEFDKDAMIYAFKVRYGLAYDENTKKTDSTFAITNECKNMAYSIVVDRLTRKDEITNDIDKFVFKSVKALIYGVDANTRIKYALFSNQEIKELYKDEEQASSNTEIK